MICVLYAVFACALCFVIQWGCYTFLKHNEARFVSSIGEENSLLRLQAVHEIEAPVIFMGSSLTERLLPRKSSAGVAMPGSSFVHVNEFMKTCFHYKPGTVYVLEVNGMFSPLNRELVERTEEWSFAFFRSSSHFSLAAKPTNLLLSVFFYILEHNKYETKELFDDIPAPVVKMDDVPEISEEQKRSWAYLIEGVNFLKKQGGRICFVNHPARITPERYKQSFEKGCILAKYLGIPVLNYDSPEWSGRLEFSDNTHLRSRRKSTVMYMNTAAQSASLIAVD